MTLPMELLQEAAALRLLAVTFARPRADWLAEVTALAREARDPIVAELARGADEGVYHALFGPGGAVSPREVAYRNFEDPGRILAEINLAHEVFGYAPRDPEDPADHLSVELDFLAYLCLKEAFAVANDDAGSAEVSRRARELFVDQHLGPLGRGFVARLGDGGPAYLVHASTRLRALLPPGDAPAAGCDEGDCEGCPGLEQ